MKICIQRKRVQGSSRIWLARCAGLLIGVLHLLVSVNTQAMQLNLFSKKNSSPLVSNFSYGAMEQRVQNPASTAGSGNSLDGDQTALSLVECTRQERPATETDLLSEAFIKGFRYELANRAFALQLMQRLAKSSEGHELSRLWSAYLSLEQFNEPRYQMAAATWGLDASPSWWGAFKAWAVTSLVPQALHSTLLTFVHAETKAYVDKLKVLQGEGPYEAHFFLSYMVAQEELQVEMMALAMAGRHSEIEKLVTEFITRSVVQPPTDLGLSHFLQP